MKKLDLIEDRWLSIKEIAEYLGVRRETIYVYLEKKNLPGHRIGKFWKFKKLKSMPGCIPAKLQTEVIDEHISD